MSPSLARRRGEAGHGEFVGGGAEDASGARGPALAVTARIDPIPLSFAAQVGGLDIARGVDAAGLAAVRAAVDRHAVVVLRDQKLCDETQIAFARHFGEPENSVLSERKDVRQRLGRAEMVDVSNIDAATGQPLGAADGRAANPAYLGNRLWHTDSSFRLPCGALSMLYAHVVPALGGETEFADLRAAYDVLPEAAKRRLEGRFAEHSLAHSRAVLGFPAEPAAAAPVAQPLVRTHPLTGRKSLYLASHAAHVVGMPVPNGRVLLMELIEHATQRAFVYRHAWRPGDLVIWDNRCTMHRGMPYDETCARDLRRVTTKDEAAADAALPGRT